MRRQQNTTGFNKEKLAFMVAAAFCALGVYHYFSSGPVLLAVGKPISTNPGPMPLSNISPPRPFEERFYIVPGTVSRMLDPRTNDLVNRNRKTPFAPSKDFVKKTTLPSAAELAKLAPPPPPPPPPPLADKLEKDEKKGPKKFSANDRDAQVAYVGVVIINGQTYGMLKPKDGGAPTRVKVGDRLKDFDYTITKIDKQAIYLVDKDNLPYLIKDDRFSGETTVADASSKAKGDGDGADTETTPKDKKTDKTPKDKAKPDKADKKADKPEKVDKPAPTKKDTAAAPDVPGIDPEKLKKAMEMLKRKEQRAGNKPQ
ncbi:MAG TPA: hypothetical protein VGP72_07295 [Planctomycetota bacterium]|jgi:hypothetical protein